MIPSTSTTQSTVNTPSSTARVRALSTKYDVTQVIAASVAPNDTPKVTALRHDTGPPHGRGSITNISRCSNPEATRIAATT